MVILLLYRERLKFKLGFGFIVVCWRVFVNSFLIFILEIVKIILIVKFFKENVENILFGYK